MRYLVDTNIISETIRRKPDAAVLAWWGANQGVLCTSTITIGELRYGIEILPPGDRKAALHVWLKRSTALMKGQTLGFSTSVAHVWGQLRAKWKAEGVVVPLVDGQLAAIAKRHSLTIATRNIKDFRSADIDVINPFDL